MNHRSIVFSLIVISCLLRSSSDAANNNWTNNTGGLWESANWSLGNVPGASDTVNIGISGAYTVTMGSTAINAYPGTLTNTALNVYNINSVSSGTPTLDINFTNAATLSVSTFMNIGNAIVNMNTPNGGVSLGGYPNGLYMGNSSFGLTGTLNVVSGTYDAGGFLVLASSPGSYSTVNVLTGGQFKSGFGRIGNNGTALININGGSVALGNEITGYSLGATGRIVMSSGYLFATNGNAVGIGSGDNNSANHGYGQLIISNGNFYNASFYSMLTIGSGVDAAGGGGVGDMRVYGGNHTNLAYIITGGSINSTGTTLLAGGTWSMGSRWFVGANSNAYGRLTITNTTMRSLSQAPAFFVGSYGYSRGEMILDGGELLLDVPLNQYDAWVEVGSVPDGNGKLTVNGGRLQIKNAGVGLLMGTGNLNFVTPVTNNTGTASVTLNGGRVELARITSVGNGVLSNRTGGLLQFLGADLINAAPSSLIVDGGTLSYKGYAALNVTGSVAKFTVVSGSGLELDSSTNVNIAGSYVLDNSPSSFKDLSLTGTGSLWRSDSLQINSGSRLHVSKALNARVSGAITNAGTILVENSTVTYQNPVTISGRYISDPSTNTYNSNVTVAVSGTLEGGIGDRFDFKKNLFINSTNKTQFDLSLSEVRFSGGGNHTNAVTGGDFGTNNFPMQNFSYGRLSLASSTDHVYFASGGFSNGSASNALYVTDLDLLGNTNLVANLHSSFNIYYMISVNDPFNAYLNDRTYGLQGGGFLMPAIPEPSMLALLLTAGMVFVWGRRRW